MARYDFEIIGEMEGVETIARGTGVRIRHFLNQTYGRGAWRKRKGVALVRYANGQMNRAEVHWFEAHGIGRVLQKVIREID
jgi:hypothetical protein